MSIGIGVIQRITLQSGTSVTVSPFTAPSSSVPSVYTIYNNSGSGFTFNLPASPVKGQEIIIVDAALTAAAHTITINGNGKNIVAYGLSQTSIGIASNGGSVALSWDGINWAQYA